MFTFRCTCPGSKSSSPRQIS